MNQQTSSGDERWAATCERLREVTSTAFNVITATADQLDRWAEQSVSGGWSTHQVDPMRARANWLRRESARLRSLADR
jgi:hypothetical protein